MRVSSLFWLLIDSIPFYLFQVFPFLHVGENAHHHPFSKLKVILLLIHVWKIMHPSHHLCNLHLLAVISQRNHFISSASVYFHFLLDKILMERLYIAQSIQQDHPNLFFLFLHSSSLHAYPEIELALSSISTFSSFALHSSFFSQCFSRNNTRHQREHSL